MSVAGRNRMIDTDASEVFVFPKEEVAEEHHVVAAVHGGVGGVAVP